MDKSQAAFHFEEPANFPQNKLSALVLQINTCFHR